jgi:hypothetical protein
LFLYQPSYNCFHQSDKHGIIWVKKEAYIRLHQSLVLAKASLREEKKKGDTARLEVIRLRSERDDESQKDTDEDIHAVVRKHGAKPKKTSQQAKKPIPKTSKQAKKPIPKPKGNPKRTFKELYNTDEDDGDDSDASSAEPPPKRTPPPSRAAKRPALTTTKESDEDDSNKSDEEIQESEVEGRQSEDEGELSEDEDKQSGDEDDEESQLPPESPMAQIPEEPVPASLVPIPGTPNQIVEMECKEDHANLQDFRMEGNPAFCVPGQKFGDAVCMSCATEFTNNTKDATKVMPNLDEPLRFCPNFESVCTAVLCHSCYVAQLVKTNNNGPNQLRRSRRH